MWVIRIAAVALATMLSLTASPLWGESKHSRHMVFEEGQGFCPARTLVLEGIAIRGGRCYVLAALRDRRGAFIAFMDPSARMAKRRAVRLDSEEGRKVRARIFYLVPMPANSHVALIPLNTIQLIQLREDDDEDDEEGEGEYHEREHHERVVRSSLTIVLTATPTPNTLITFVINF